MRAPAAIAALLAFGCGEETRAPLVFTVVRTELTHEADVRIDLADPLAARARVLEAAGTRSINPTWLGAGPWQTVAVHRADIPPEQALAAGRTFIRQGGALHLDARLGAGDRGTFMGGVAATGAERALLELRVEDPETLNARFVVRVHAVEGGRHRDATPHYLRRAVPRGTYRVWLDVPPSGGRYLVEVRTVDRSGEVCGRAWSSPLAVERPWL